MYSHPSNGFPSSENQTWNNGTETFEQEQQNLVESGLGGFAEATQSPQDYWPGPMEMWHESSTSYPVKPSGRRTTSAAQEVNETQIKRDFHLDVSGLPEFRTVTYGIDRLLLHRIISILQWCTDRNQTSTSMSNSVIVIALPGPQ